MMRDEVANLGMGIKGRGARQCGDLPRLGSKRGLGCEGAMCAGARAVQSTQPAGIWQQGPADAAHCRAPTESQEGVPTLVRSLMIGLVSTQAPCSLCQICP
eukprot:1160929-Pelagomonas_calceolata.AAC.10